MIRQNNFIMAPAKVSVEEEHIYLRDPDMVPVPGKSAAISLSRITCVLMKKYDLLHRRFYFVEPESVEENAEGHLIIFQGTMTRWELHFFRCDTEAGYTYHLLEKYLSPDVFKYKDENDYIGSEDEKIS